MIRVPRLVFSGDGRKAARLEELLTPGVRRAPDRDVYAAYATWSLLADREATVYEGLRSKLEEERFPDLEELPRNEDDAVRALRKVLEDAIERAMGDHERIAVFTGGGVDSGILLGIAVTVGRRLRKQVVALALDYGGPGDDRPFLVELERRLDCEVIRVAPESGAPFMHLLDGVDAAPFYCPTGPMEVAAMHEAKSRGITCLLAGAAGDQLFDGRASDLSRFVRRGEIVEAVRRARRLRGFDRGRMPLVSWLARPLAASLLPRRARARRVGKPNWHEPPWAGPAMVRYRDRRRRNATALLEATLPDLQPFEEAIFADQRVQFAWLRHQVSAVSGLLRVDPYLDPRVVAFAKAIPREWHLHGGIRRGLLRAAARDVIPRSLFEREDKANAVPGLVRFFLAAGGERAVRAYAGVEALAELEVVNRERFQDAYRAFIELPAEPAGWLGAWCVLSLERFARTR